ncbi:hypothetical protein NRIC_36630 [Enterococcus florum]|uniref:TPM domain-containing protein n=1 Tax=Enterococcus florum TaxID=2480627 RepID=A0A4P5PJK7_9ENTE|nr:TPM domain-containing protein [Enterococcus florum]GCF95772.1 hypothetical protein NRIC_36630 [Enterococcus florum]
MKKEGSEADLERRIKKLDQQTQRKYRSLKKGNSIWCIVLALITAICLAVLGSLFLTDRYRNHVAGKRELEQQIVQMEEERYAILSGNKQVATEDFEDILQENLANLKEYPKKSDFYTVDIKDTDSAIHIDRNNIFVSDNANLLSSETKSKIYKLNKQLAASTKGSQLEVVTVKELPSGESIESYAEKIFNQLGIGDREENNGVLYLIALEDREFRLEVGYGLEGLLTDSTADDIINDADVVDDFKDEKYDSAVNQVLDGVFSVMNSKTALVDARIAQLEREKRSGTVFYWIVSILMILFALIAVLLLVKGVRARQVIQQHYRAYQEERTKIHQTTSESSKRVRVSKLKKSDFYYLTLSGITLVWSMKQIKHAIKRGKIFAKYPHAVKHGAGQILVGDTLYGYNGNVLTTSYLASQYNSDNHSDGSGSGGSSSWGSFGGGSSGGGGASGGW